MSRVLLTGAGGFIGRATVAPLLAAGHEVHVVDLRRSDTMNAGVIFHEADLLAPGAAARIAAEVEASHLVHLAWYAAHGLFWTSPENLRWVSASLELIRAFHDAGGRRAVVAGSCAEYDWSSGWCSERSTPLAPATLYGVAKDALRRTLAAYAASTGLGWAWGRVFLLYGRGEHPDRLVPSVARSVLRGEPTRCTHGRQIRDFLHVEDVGAAFAALADAEHVQGPVNVASGEPRSIREVVTSVAAISGTPELARFGDVPAPAEDPPLLVADVRRLRDEVGFTPRRSLAEGLSDAVDWWREVAR